MRAHFLKLPLAWRCLMCLAGMLCVCVPRMAYSQTPSPLQEWLYPGGTILDKVFDPDQPGWHVVRGGAMASMPRYGGARVYQVSAGPVIDIPYRDIAFASVGEGLGWNI
jgi:hypothetical protein